MTKTIHRPGKHGHRTHMLAGTHEPPSLSRGEVRSTTQAVADAFHARFGANKLRPWVLRRSAA